MADPPSCGELACDAGEVHDRTNLAPVRTQAPSPTGSGAGFVAALSDGWTASGPFRAAPMGYVLHNGTPAGTPLASPRHTAGQGDDLEAPLLAANRSGGLKAEGSAGSAALKAMTFGVINTCAGVPALIAFCAVVFKDPVYEPWLDPLCRLMFLSSAVHQGVVCARSAVPWAVGQVQDVGLIFLSAMTSSIADACTARGLDAAAALGTSLLTLAVSTLLVGLGLLAVARARMAAVVQYLPLPAVAGYLSYVGYFCVASGLGLGCGVELGPLASWALLWDKQAALRAAPTLASCLACMLVMARCKHPAALPTTLAAIVALFHAVLLVAGVSLAQAQQAGWVLKPAASSGRFWELWRLFDMPGLSLQRLHLGAALAQGGKLVGLFILVTFGCCMDIAAIQSGTPFRLDFNAELATVGLSNVATGALGAGFTGSFIFSQTIFTGGAGVQSRLNGAVIALSELALFATPFSVVQYLPRFFFGGLLVWFGVEILIDWMFHSYQKLSKTEYALLWATFCAIFRWGLEAGVAAGCVAAALYFVFAYSRSQLSAFSLGPARSGVVRAPDQQAALDLLRPAHLTAARLRGFLFFGCANAVSSRLHRAAQRLHAGEGGAGWGAGRAAAAAPRFLVLDLSRAMGVDATAARTLGTLFRDLAQLDVTPLVTGVGGGTARRLLVAHGVPLPPAPAQRADDASPFLLRSAADLALHCHEFVSYEEGVRYAEHQLLAAAVRRGLCRPPSEGLTLEQVLRAHASQAALPFVAREGSARAAAAIQRYADTLRLCPGERLWERGQSADALFIVEQGRVTVEQRQAAAATLLEEQEGQQEGQQQQQQEGQQQEGANGRGGSQGCRPRVFEFGAGCVAGAVDLYLARPRSSTATASGTGGAGGGGACRVLRLTREALGRMAEEDPAALHFLQAVVLRAKCVDLGQAAELAVARV